MSQELQAEWRETIEAVLGGEPNREITEEGEWLFDLRRTQFRLEETPGRLLLHLWSPERDWIRRVVGVAQEDSERLVIQVERFGQPRPGKLVVAPPRGRRTGEGERAAARRAYAGWLRRLLEREFPRARLHGLTTSADLKRSFSGLYTRVCLQDGTYWWAVLGVNAGETATVVDGLLTYGLIWLDWNRQRFPERAWAGLHLFLPQGRVETTAARLAGLDRLRVRVKLSATDEDDFTCQSVDPGELGNLDTHLAPARLAEAVLAQESSAVERLRALAPEAIDVAVPAGRPELVLRFRGLEFARARGGQVSFGLERKQQRLTEENFSALASLVERLDAERRAGGSPRSPLYRVQAERWLESLALAAPQSLDPRLEPRPLYRQVPAFSGEERGVADLLGVTREGQLVVLELKASSDIHLPLQGLDYWLRVRWHHEREELASAGYFPEIKLKPQAPELLLVSPDLEFHPTTEILSRYLAPEVKVTLLGLNQDWRGQLKVTSRRRASDWRS